MSGPGERFLCTLLSLLAIVAAVSVAAGQTHKAGAKKTAAAIVMAARGAEAIRVSVVSLASPQAPSGIPSFADLNLGDLAYGKESAVPGVRVKWTRSAIDLSTRFGLLLEDGENRDFRTAMVRAFVGGVDSGITYSIDGIKLTMIPRTISAAAPIGAVRAHRLEIDIPTSKAPGPVASNVGFLVTPN